ncbi:MAG TPA: amino acid adenylation domain-containing protein, partial [Longimicrobium sp.]|nr:amino acid adenylation domain-containing protein [Longimicrobium sp.]
TLVLRGDLSGDPTPRELVRRARAAVVEAQAHQDVPFERLVDELGVERSRLHAPLFQAVFALDAGDGGGGRRLRLAGVEAEALEQENGTAKYDLILSLRDAGEAIEGALEYRTDLFSAATAGRLAAHFAALAGAMAADPDRPLSDFALAEGEERARVVEEWNRTESEYPRDATLHGLFAAQAARTPDAVAVSWAGGSLTYAVLKARAERIAHLVRLRGVEPEARVGLFMERGPEAVAAMLGVLMAGGCYVPLDPSHPAERVREVAREAGVSLVLAEARLGLRAPAGLPVQVVDVAPPGCAGKCGGCAAACSLLAPAEARADSLAYVMFTSGSTGRPKGVAVPHRAVVRLVTGNDFAALSPDEVVLHLAPAAFDAATFEVWGALLHGARLVLFPPHAPTLDELGAFVAEEGITTMWLTAGLFHQVADEQAHRLGGVRQLLAGGDALSLPHVRRVLDAHPGLRLINGYGPTENTTFSACHAVRAEDLGRAGVPIGRPIRNSTAYVLDGAMRPLPPGVPGELYVGGDGLARGYLGRPALTAERFVPSPFRGGERLYRTGDRARWMDDGTLEFLGRIDRQVKIRGFRVEPGEVEALLASHPAVRGAAVDVRADAGGGSRLVAYAVPGEGASTDPAALRGWLKERLPDFMLPAAVVLLDALPLTPNGKVDRRALPDPELAPGADRHVAPRTEDEAVMAGLWAEVLGVERVGVEDDFFALGGHSLLAVRVVSRVRDAFGVELPLRAVLEHPTLAAQAREVEALRGAGEGTRAAPPLVALPREGALPLSFAQQRLWFLHQLDPSSAAYNVPAALRLRGALDERALARALAEVVRRHEALRTRFEARGGVAAQVVDASAALAVPSVDLSALDEGDREATARRLAREEALRPFDLSVAPLLRATLARLAEGEWILLLTMHHVAGDGWSLEVLARELSTLYAAFAAGRPSPLAELEIQYADFAAWQRGWLTDEALAGELA